jgi:regulator of replication initiation timing
MEKRTRMPVDKINEMMNSSGMHWFNSNEMLEHGMIDEIVPTEQKFIKPLTTNAFDLYKVYNNLNNENNMDFKEIMKGLFPGKSDAEMVTNTISLNTENSVLKAEVEKLKAKLAEAEVIIEQSTKSVKEVIVKNLIESAIDAGKIKEDRKSFWTAAALSDLEGVKAELEIMQVKAATKTKSAMSVIGTASPAKDETETYAYLTKNNPAKLQQMLVTDPEHFEKLLDEYNPKENK